MVAKIEITMAQTAGVINGTDLRLYVGGNAVAYAVTCNLSMSRELRETIHKDNPGSGWREVDPAQASATLTTDGLFNEDGTNNAPADLFTIFAAKTQVSWYFSNENAGDTRYYGNGYITALDYSATVEENATYSVTIEVDGQVQTATLT